MNREELGMRAGRSWRGGDDDAFLRRWEMAKICPEFPTDRAQEHGVSLLPQLSGCIRRILIRAARRFSRQPEVMSQR